MSLMIHQLNETNVRNIIWSLIVVTSPRGIPLTFHGTTGSLLLVRNISDMAFLCHFLPKQVPKCPRWHRLLGVNPTVTIICIPYGGKLWWQENLANCLLNYLWRNKIWQIAVLRSSHMIKFWSNVTCMYFTKYFIPIQLRYPVV